MSQQEARRLFPTPRHRHTAREVPAPPHHAPGNERLQHRDRNTLRDSVCAIWQCLPLTGHRLTSLSHYSESRGPWQTCSLHVRQARSPVLFSRVPCSAGLRVAYGPVYVPQSVACDFPEDADAGVSRVLSGWSSRTFLPEAKQMIKSSSSPVGGWSSAPLAGVGAAPE